jgi:hypothetical protein
VKKKLIWIAVSIILAGAAYGLELSTLNIDMQHELIFCPGEPIIFKAYAEQEADSAVLIIVKDKSPVETIRMQLLSDFPRQFAYILDNELEQGDYAAKVLSNGETAEAEFYIGYEIESQLMARDEIRKPGFFENLWNWLISLFGKNE